MDNFRFANPHVLWLLVVVLLLVLLYQWGRYMSKKSLARFGDVNLLRALTDGVSKQKPRMKFVLQVVALVCLIVAGARPQFGSKLQNVKKEGIEVMVCLDISNSMLAVVVFAGDAVVQLPITNDYVSAKMFLESISPENISVQGTAIGAAINLAVRSFTPREESSKAIILITDAENHEDDASGAAAAAFEKGIPTHVIGVGSTQGTVIPDGSGHKNSPRKDSTGNPITTRLDEAIARQVAESGHGIYAHADNSNSAINAVIESLNQMQTTELESHVYAEYDDQFIWFVLLAFICMAIDIVLVDRANPMFSKIKLFE